MKQAIVVLPGAAPSRLANCAPSGHYALVRRWHSAAIVLSVFAATAAVGCSGVAGERADSLSPNEGAEDAGGTVASSVVGRPAATEESGAASRSSPVPDVDCDAATPIVIHESGPEVRGVSTNSSIYGLLFLTHVQPIRSGDEVKIVWRMTGDGDLTATATSPTGRRGEMTFGPEPHSGSSYSRPGDEWGTGFLFDEPGCWHIRLERNLGSGDVWLDVV